LFDGFYGEFGRRSAFCVELAAPGDLPARPYRPDYLAWWESSDPLLFDDLAGLVDDLDSCRWALAIFDADGNRLAIRERR
jgi:hypothetical protein